VSALRNCKVLTFDLFGTVLDLGGSLTPFIAEFIRARDAQNRVDPSAFWGELRHRQRIEQYQDSLVELGHTGYLETAQKAFVYVAKLNRLAPDSSEVDAFMAGWQQLKPFPDCLPGLQRLKTTYKLVALSNGNPWFLDHLVENRIKFDFDDVISVEVAGAFKPHPGVYRSAARLLDMEPGELIMVSSNSFDVMGARTCGLRGIYVNRYNLPFEDTDARYEPDLIVPDFSEMADHLLGD
jgi:2-haloacid dehalogenase